MQIGPFVLRSPVWLAPMAGVTDLPFRELCWRFGVGLTISEMLASKEALRENPRTRLRAHFGANTGPRVVQLLGTDPMQFAEAARYHVDRGAEWIDLNMGCPAKKVCQVAAGSALLRDEDRVARIFDAVTRAVNVPVTVKIRTGWDPQQRNAVRIAQLAERSGLSAITVHGRTRTCGFHGAAEYDTIRHVKQAVRIPVIANGDIDSATKARAVLRHTGADALMIGRAALGRPWLFQEVTDALRDDMTATATLPWAIIREHLQKIHEFYGEADGVRLARKHLVWYFKHVASPTPSLRERLLQTTVAAIQLCLAEEAFGEAVSHRAPVASHATTQ